jgi:hypothetical protein
MGKVEAVKCLLDSGADQKIKSNDGRTARDMVETLEGLEAQAILKLLGEE